MTLNPKKEGTLPYILLLTGFLMLLEFSYFIQCNRAYLSDYTFVSKNLSIPLTILPGIFYFIAAEFTIHLAYALIVWIVVTCLPFRNKVNSAIIIWLLGVITIFVANQYYFPNSKFAELTSLILTTPGLVKTVYFILITACIGVCLLVVSRSFFIFAISTLFICISFFILKTKTDIPINNPATASRPNIILIGIDSLRPDFLSYFGYDNKTPFLDAFLNQSAVFTEAVTPLARTFPSWSSILLGQYPRESRIRSNLSQQQFLHFDDSLPAILQRHGYETIYATDETRFSNIDKNFGFNRIISPPMGLNDFLIGNFNDFPLSNVLVNTVIGKWLFPHGYANRPVHFTYNPDSFLQLLKPVLAENHQQPLLLAVHFCLTHTPYLWADYAGEGQDVKARYVASIQRVDEQIQDFFILLKQYHLLDHAIVVLLSDHGETLELSGDRITEKELFISSKEYSSIPQFYPQGLDDEAVNQSAGHGTDVLGLPQYHTLLAFQLYGVEKNAIGDIPGVVSLIDIKPTLLQYLQLPSPNSSGISLLKWIQGIETANLNTRHIFLESDFSPAAIRTVYPEVRKVMLEGIDIFEINPLTTRLTIKDEMTTKIIASKQYADIYGEWMLALYPKEQHKRTAILINLNSGQWTDDLQNKFAKDSPAQLMLAQLRVFYGDEIVDVE